MTEHDWQQQDLDKYDFAVKPGTPDYEERVAELTLQQQIQQSKAFRAYFWDRYGTTGELGPDYFQIADDDIRQMEDELANGEFRREFDQLSDDEVLLTARSWLVNLTANDNEQARLMGFSDEYLEDYRAKIAAMEKAVEEEKKAIWRAEKGRVNKAAETLLKKLGPSSKPFLFQPPKPPGDADTN
jgi:hypothetical protein